MKKTNALVLLALAGTCVTTVNAQVGGVVNISGATLLENYVRSQASTNDFIDVDGDGIAGYLGTSLGGLPDDLALGGPTGFDGPGALADQELVIQYRVTGSVNGFNELLFFGGPSFVTSDAFATFPAGIPGAAQSSGQPNPGLASAAYHNRVLYIGNGTGGTTSGVRTGFYNQGNPGGAPNRSDLSTLLATYSSPDTPSAGGIRIDVAPLDVATFLAVRKPGAAAFDRAPSEAGYGTNPVRSVNKQGTLTGANLDNRLLELQGRNLFESYTDANNNSTYDAGEVFVDSDQDGIRDNPDVNTIFDTALLFAPIAPVTNFGTGLTQVTMTQLQHLFVTGRASSGENFMIITRDVGSGTRNAFNNGTGVDPSFGNGENIGALSNSSTQNLVGPNFIPTNKGSNGNMEATLRNTRLGLGYIGTERGVTGSGSGSWLVRDGSGNSALEILDTRNDIYGGTTFVRPTIQNLLNNDASGWVIGGEAVLATLGDPRANSAALGGVGFAGAFDPFIDANSNGVYDAGETYTDLNGNNAYDASNAEAGLFNSNTAMANPFAAGYLNNISRSIAAFDSVPASPENTFSPGEFAASQFLSLAAVAFDHLEADYTQLQANPAFNQRIQNYILSTGTNVHFNPVFATANAAGTGRVPTRTTGVVYTDSVANGANYVSQLPANVAYGSNLTLRNKITGDFDGNGARSNADAPEMLRAWSSRNGGPAWTAPAGTGAIAGAPGTDAVIELLGDFDSNGNFNRADIRYWADGLALTGGTLDRKAGFIAIDNASNIITGTLNFFNTTKSTGTGYNAGDSRGDVSNSGGQVTPGFAPIGADRNNGSVDADDNRIDISDLNYIVAQFRGNDKVTDGEANWSNLAEASGFDLSADITGNLIVNQDDVTELVNGVLGTFYGDLDLDGSVSCAERNSILGAVGTTTTGGYGAGDLNGDGNIDTSDVALLFGSGGVCGGDLDCDGDVDSDDIVIFFAGFEAGSQDAEQDGDGDVDSDDVTLFFGRFEGGC